MTNPCNHGAASLRFTAPETGAEEAVNLDSGCHDGERSKEGISLGEL
jgi:hypothetical protein